MIIPFWIYLVLGIGVILSIIVVIIVKSEAINVLKEVLSRFSSRKGGKK